MTAPLPFYGKCPLCERPLAGDNLQINGREAQCVHCWNANGKTDHTFRDPELVAADQVSDVKIAMDRPLSEYLHLPFPSVNAIVGAIPPGDVGFISAFSGLGKTTFVTSAVKGFLEQGKMVYCLPLESEPMRFRTHLACKALGYHAGMVLTGEYKRSMPDAWPEIRAALVAELDRQRRDLSDQLYISPTRRMDVRALRKAAEHAAKIGADVVIVDHLDHISEEGGFEGHKRVVDCVLDVTQDSGFGMFCTSQVNNEGVKNDPLGQYMIPRPHHVYMGGKKRQIAAWMIGLGRCLMLSGVDRDQLAAVRAGRLEAWKVLEPNCMVVGAMKLRNFGERDGHKTWLRVANGCAMEDESLIATALHGINTGGYAA